MDTKIELVIRSGATYPPVTCTVKDQNGDAYNLSDVDTVTFTMYDGDGNKVDGESATITDASAGKVKYEWSANDTDTSGMYSGYFTITFNDGSVMIAPSGNVFKIYVERVE